MNAKNMLVTTIPTPSHVDVSTFAQVLPNWVTLNKVPVEEQFKTTPFKHFFMRVLQYLSSSLMKLQSLQLNNSD